MLPLYAPAIALQSQYHMQYRDILSQTLSKYKHPFTKAGLVPQTVKEKQRKDALSFRCCFLFSIHMKTNCPMMAKMPIAVQ